MQLRRYRRGSNSSVGQPLQVSLPPVESWPMFAGRTAHEAMSSLCSVSLDRFKLDLGFAVFVVVMVVMGTSVRPS
jgi:hypothetical protein